MDKGLRRKAWPTLDSLAFKSGVLADVVFEGLGKAFDCPVQPIGAAVILPTLDTHLAFNQTPPIGKIRIAFGQGRNARQPLHALLSHKDVANAENAGAVFCLSPA